jgi:hypothetical protein
MRHTGHTMIPAWLVTWIVFVTANHAVAQQTTNMPAATQPGAGRFIVLDRVKFTYFGDDPTPADRNIKRWTNTLTIGYGLAGDLAAFLEVPVVRQFTTTSDGRDSATGVADLHAMLKWRVWQNDTGPLDTQRLSLMAGLDVPTYDRDFSSESFDPMLGVAYTQIQGRHGVNAALRYTFTTDGEDNPIMPGSSTADLLRYDASYLYRLIPERFGPQSPGAAYAMLELNGNYETNGDHELFISPGLMYEGRGWVVELSVQLPLYQELSRRPEADFAIVLGGRILF